VKPTLGRIVIYRSQAGVDYAAVISGTLEQPAGMPEESFSTPTNVHLAVFDPAGIVNRTEVKESKAGKADEQFTTKVRRGVVGAENVPFGGPATPEAGDEGPGWHSWRWPERV
jgi:hypothetical protein